MIDRGLVNAVVFLDFKKTFNTADHDILLRKLQYYAMRRSFKMVCFLVAKIIELKFLIYIVVSQPRKFWRAVFHKEQY